MIRETIVMMTKPFESLRASPHDYHGGDNNHIYKSLNASLRSRHETCQHNYEKATGNCGILDGLAVFHPAMPETVTLKHRLENYYNEGMHQDSSVVEGWAHNHENQGSNPCPERLPLRV